MREQPIVMISSTARDLPEYRAQVMDACLRAGMFPKMMEQMPALDADAIKASLALVDEADVYVGLFAHRYGHIPEGHDISITEMEYEGAVERDIPRLIFLMHDKVPVLPEDVDKGDSALKLEALKARLKKERVVDFFKNPEDLRGLALHALTEVKKELDKEEADGDLPGETMVRSLHNVSAISKKPEPYIAHPYTLLQVRRLIGRKSQLEMLTDWLTKPRFKDIAIFNIVAIGGMGKSALTWTRFKEIRQELYFAALAIIEEAGARLAVPTEVEYQAPLASPDPERLRAIEREVAERRERGEMAAPPFGRRPDQDESPSDIGDDDDSGTDDAGKD